jgi:hypothetical protein
MGRLDDRIRCSTAGDLRHRRRRAKLGIQGGSVYEITSPGDIGG